MRSADDWIKSRDGGVGVLVEDELEVFRVEADEDQGRGDDEEGRDGGRNDGAPRVVIPTRRGLERTRSENKQQHGVALGKSDQDFRHSCRGPDVLDGWQVRRGMSSLSFSLSLYLCVRLLDLN